jgi:hypothetical protein
MAPARTRGVWMATAVSASILSVGFLAIRFASRVSARSPAASRRP